MCTCPEKHDIITYKLIEQKEFKMDDSLNFFKNDDDGLKRVKAIVKKANTSKSPYFKLNSIRLFTSDGKGKWAQDRFCRSKVISEVAAIVHPHCGTGNGSRLYSALLHVVGIGTIAIAQPKQETSAAIWLESYNTVFADYQEYLHLAS